MKYIITLVSIFFLSVSMTGCGKKPYHESMSHKVIWQEMKVVGIEPAEYKHGINDAGLNRGTTRGNGGFIFGTISLAGHILAGTANLVTKGVSAVDSSMTAGPGATLLVDRLDDNSTDTKRTIVLRLSDEELCPDDVTAIYLEGAHSEETDIKIGTHIAGLFNPTGGLLQLSADLTLVGKSEQQLRDEKRYPN